MTLSNRPIAIVDTNILSYGLRGNPLAFTYASLLADYDAQICFMTAAELRWGAERGRWSQRRRLEMEIMLGKFPIAPCTDRVTTLYVQVQAERCRVGRPIDPADAWIAATAISLDAPLATHDANFSNTPGLKLITANQREVHAFPRLRAGARPTRPMDMNCSCGL